MNNIWIRLLQMVPNGTQRSLESLPPKVQFSIYARFDGNHIQNVDFVKFILQEATVRNKNNPKHHYGTISYTQCDFPRSIRQSKYTDSKYLSDD